MSARALRLALVAAVVAATLGATPRAAPPFRLALLDGGALASRELAGEVVVLNFWATWCAPCRAELPALDRYFRKHRARGLRIVAVNVDASVDRERLRALTRDFAFPVALLDDSDAAVLMDGSTLPQTVVIDRQNRVLRRGWTADPHLDEEQLDAVLGPLLATRP